MNTHGGKRRNQLTPMLSPEQVRKVREMRNQRMPYKLIARVIPASRETLGAAARGSRTYKGFA